ncbi:MAG: hypothetical protein WA952_13870 [Lewinella sp.]
MNRTLVGVVWLSVYLFAVLAPIGLMLVPPVPTGRSFLVELSVALGFVGLTQIGIQFVLIGRFKPLTYPYGIDVVLIHPLVLLIQHPARIVLFNPFGGSCARPATDRGGSAPLGPLFVCGGGASFLVDRIDRVPRGKVSTFTLNGMTWIPGSGPTSRI